ncbi:hypothetical protein JTB14_002187 [Gonioctena quinquepunctata]|nr:hypothetical protein JTB14_002187 [Gonioctena quinquepunctata]
MQCDDVDLKVSGPQINELDNALDELGMLASSANSREEYLGDLQNKYLNMLSINSKYVRNVSIGFRVRPLSSRKRYKPYEYPKEVRHRTRSENNDIEAVAVVKSVVDELDCAIEEFKQLKKAKSLECVAEKSTVHPGSDKMSELEVVSDSIQNLKVGE